MKTTLGMVFVLALVGCGTVQGDAGRPLKVLAVGNSFSLSLIHEWPQVAKAAGRPLAGQTYCANADWFHRFAAVHGMRRMEPSADRIDTLLILVDGHVPTEKEALAAYVEDLCRKHPNAELVFASASRDVERVLGRYDVRFFRLPPDLPDDDLVTAFERWY